MFIRGSALTLLCACSLALLIAGCANSPATTTTTRSLATSVTTTPTATPVGLTSAIATLKHMPVGNVTFNWDHSNHMLTMNLVLSGLAPDSVHPVQISEGTCDNLRKVAYPLSPVTADAHGVVQAEEKVSVPNGIPTNNWAFNVLNGPDTATPDHALSIACGNVTNHDTSLRSSQTVQLALTEAATKNTGQNVAGLAHFTLKNQDLKVDLVLTGLEPNSEHMAHIHAGSCASQGATIYSLPTIKADASGKATVTTTIPHISSIPASGWYVSIHRGMDLSNQSNFDPLACGNVTATTTQP